MVRIPKEFNFLAVGPKVAELAEQQGLAVTKQATGERI